MTELERKIKDAEKHGWEMKEKIPDERAVMKKKGKGSILFHLAILIPSLGMGNILYFLYCRIFKAEKTVLTA